MKKLVLGLLVLALCAGPASAGSVGLFGSSYSPNDTDSVEGFGVDFEAGEGRTQFQMRFSLYTDFRTDPNPEIFELEATPIDFGVNWNFGGGASVKPYGGIGVTYALFDFSVDTTPAPGQPRGVDIDPEFGYYAQIGLDFTLNDSWEMTAEAVYRILDAEVEVDDIGLPIDQAVSMSGVALNVGIGVHW